MNINYIFPSTDQDSIDQLKYLLLDSRNSDSLSPQTIITLEYSDQSISQTYDRRFVLVSESQYRHGVKKWINYSESLCSSEFCLVIDADNANRFNLFDSIACGCIPVIVNDDIVLPFSEVLDWNKMAIRIPRIKFQKVPSILSTYSSREILLLRKQIMFAYERYFSSIEKIMITTLDILNDRVFPQYSRSYAEWNYPDYSANAFPISPVLFYPAKAFPQAGFTALIRAHSHFALLSVLLKSIQYVKYLQQIVVVWTSKAYPVPDTILWPSLKVPLSVVRPAYGSVNGRFFPYRQIRTEAVFSIEEDTCLPSAESVERAFELWCQNPERLVSLSGRQSEQLSWHLFYNNGNNNQSFSATFPAVFFHKHYLHLYTDLLAVHVKSFVDKLETCEDAFLYWLIVQTSGGQSILSTSPVYNYNSSNLYNFTNPLLNECRPVPKHCSLHVNQLSSFVKSFRQSSYPFKVSQLTADAL
ncbi:unnamed protein product [Trichobilharzia szidati]|nr:unnamed protein product [Trichobilharzia szidati]